MKAFLAALVCMALVGVVAASWLGELKLTSEAVFASENVRLGE